jgi:hypothetical protein
MKKKHFKILKEVAKLAVANQLDAITERIEKLENGMYTDISYGSVYSDAGDVCLPMNRASFIEKWYGSGFINDRKGMIDDLNRVIEHAKEFDNNE